MRLFDTNVQELKYKVLKEVVRNEMTEGGAAGLLEIPKKIIEGPKATMRCCIYRERAIVEERVKCALGGDNTVQNVVEVIDIACDECPVSRFSVTETCRGCIAHRCSAACPVGAISFEKQKAVIDHDKCRECGKCMKVCPYNAIIESQRPCIKGCKAGAISLDENKKAKINDEKCINCGACVYQCPFGAITDKSLIVDVLKLLKGSQGGKNYKVYAAIAPSIATQFNYAKIGQIMSGIKKLGFHDVVEVALGADITGYKDAMELKNKGFLTSSCCPSFVKYIEINFPALAGNVSENLSPMAEIAHAIKKTDKTAKVVFIGPCIAKKAEFKKPELAGIVDSVLTFEELQAMLDGVNIRVEELPEDTLENASCFGRMFARSGGVAGAVAQALHEDGSGFELKPEICDGIETCKIALLKASKGRLDANFIEGMACEGGCIGGAACLNHGPRNRDVIDDYSKKAVEKTIGNSIDILKYMNPNKE